MEACKPLKEYSWFVDRVRTLKKESRGLGECLDITLDELPDDSLIKPFLLANKAEVKRMCITEYNEEKTLNQTLEEGIEIGEKRGIKKGREEGRAEGKVEGVLETLISLVKDGILSVAEAAKRSDMTVLEFEARAGLNV